MKRKFIRIRSAAGMLAAVLTLTAVPVSAAEAATSAPAKSTAQTENRTAADGSKAQTENHTATDGSKAQTEDSTDPDETVLSGVPESINSRRNQKVSFTVHVAPANGTRTVLLQRYKSSAKKWKTIHSKMTKDADSDDVSFTIQKDYRKRTTGRWRIRVKATKTAAECISAPFTVTTRNIAKTTVTAQAACVYCVDSGQLVFTKNSTTKRAMASITKLMTAILLCESGKLNTTTKISKKAANQAWGSGMMQKGDTYKTSDLLYAMMLPSANDAATAVAQKVGGSVSGFVSMMNQKASVLGLSDTHFRNPHGLDEKKHYSTASDVARLTAAAYGISDIRKTWKTKEKTITSLKKKRKWTLRTTDEILGYSKAFQGGKTGTTGNAGRCFTGVYLYDGKTYVTTVLGSAYNCRFTDTQKLHQYIRSCAASQY